MSSPPLPQVPVCWSWAVPMFPLPCHRGRLERWQDGRCAVCGVVPPARELRGWETPTWVSGLVQDHDHDSGDIRALLCQSCNTLEGKSSAPVFGHYRERPPTVILGLLLRYGGYTHPVRRSAYTAWGRALSTVEMRRKALAEWHTQVKVQEQMVGLGHPPWPVRPLEVFPDPLADVAERTGHRMDENPYRPGWWQEA